MAIARHTEGPWKVAKDNYGVERIRDSELDCDVACCTGDGSIPLEERQANTRLIAAAPDLLWALNQAIAYLANPQAFDKDELGKDWWALKAKIQHDT
jgi:hypothetical protein